MLVTGASGLLGANFCLAARTRFRIHACHRLHRFHCSGITPLSLDLRVASEVRTALDRLNPRIIAHFAAATDVNYCEDHRDEAAAANVQATGYLAEWAARNDADMLFMSTDSVFDGSRGDYLETDAPRPLNYYAATKLQAEEVVRSATPGHLIVRANIYGWNTQPKDSLAEWVLGRLGTGNRVPGFTDAIFAPLMAMTLSDIMLALLQQGRRGTYHAASADAVSKYDFALLIAQVFELDAGLIYRTSLAATPMRAVRPLNTALNCSKLRQEAGLAVPDVLQDLRRLRRLRDEGFANQLKHASSQL
jgi:dTDP-4-dehydrorhamnose reductase